MKTSIANPSPYQLELLASVPAALELRKNLRVVDFELALGEDSEGITIITVTVDGGEVGTFRTMALGPGEIADRALALAFWRRSSEESFYEALEVLPPIAFDGASFLLGEPFDFDAEGRSRYQAHRRTRAGHEFGSCAVNKRDFNALKRLPALPPA